MFFFRKAVGIAIITNAKVGSGVLEGRVCQNKKKNSNKHQYFLFPFFLFLFLHCFFTASRKRHIFFLKLLYCFVFLFCLFFLSNKQGGTGIMICKKSFKNTEDTWGSPIAIACGGGDFGTLFTQFVCVCVGVCVCVRVFCFLFFVFTIATANSCVFFLKMNDKKKNKKVCKLAQMKLT